jgi:hypothetical protein
VPAIPNGRLVVEHVWIEIVATKADEENPAVSPDGRWLA